MNQRPTQEMIDQWHRWFAVECNNRAWDLASKPERTSVENDEMLNIAHAAAFHWSQIGKPVNNARADVALAHIYSTLKNGAQALFYAQRSLSYFEKNPEADWDIAFAHAEMAFASVVNKDASLYTRHIAEARRLGEAIKEEEDRKVFLEELSKIPVL